MKVPLHLVRARREQLAAWMQQHGHASLQEICSRFEISEATARRDLAALAAERQIVRTYGGALADYNRRFASFHDRLALAAEAKQAIAQKAHALIRPASTIFIDAGTTLYALAEALQRSPVASLEVVTNNLPVAELLAPVADIRVHLLGGELLPRQSVLAGEAAIRSLAFHSIDTAFISAEGFDAKGAWNSHEDVVLFQQRLLATASAVVLCADSRKAGHTAPAFLSAWQPITTLLTDASADTLAALRLPSRLIS